MGKCCSKPREGVPASTSQNPDVRNEVIVDNKLFNQDITVRKGMKSGAQFGKTDDGLEAGFQVMFCKKKI